MQNMEQKYDWVVRKRMDGAKSKWWKKKKIKQYFLYCLQLGPFVDLMISIGNPLVLGPLFWEYSHIMVILYSKECVKFLKWNLLTSTKGNVSSYHQKKRGHVFTFCEGTLVFNTCCLKSWPLDLKIKIWYVITCDNAFKWSYYLNLMVVALNNYLIW